MCKFKVGDVVYALCLFGERNGVKTRPCVILSVNKDCRYHLVECYTLLDRHATIASSNVIHRVKENTQECIDYGFDNDTVITKNHGWISENFVKSPPDKKPNPIGFCDIVEKIKAILKIT